MLLKSLFDKVKEKIPQQDQVQVSLCDQLEILESVANLLGLYDAADFLKERTLVDRTLRKL